MNLRRRINQDENGALRGNNRRLGGLETLGLLLLVAGIVLWLCHIELGIGSAWAFVSAAIGLLLAKLGSPGPDIGKRGAPQELFVSSPIYRLLQAALGLALLGVGLYVIIGESSDALALVVALALLILGGNALLAAGRSRQSWLFALGGIF